MMFSLRLDYKLSFGTFNVITDMEVVICAAELDMG